MFENCLERGKINIKKVDNVVLFFITKRHWWVLLKAGQQNFFYSEPNGVENMNFRGFLAKLEGGAKITLFSDQTVLAIWVKNMLQNTKLSKSMNLLYEELRE